MYPTQHTYSDEYKEMDKTNVTIENLSSSIVTYLKAIIEERNKVFKDFRSIYSMYIIFNIYETEDNNWNISIRGLDEQVDEFIKIADALMIYRYGHRVQVNGWPIGEEGR